MKSKKELVFCDDCAFRVYLSFDEICSCRSNKVEYITPIQIIYYNGTCNEANKKNNCKYYIKKVKTKPTLLTKIWNKIK